VSIDGGRVVAIVAPGTDRPRIADLAMNGLVLASGVGTVAYLEGLTITLNGSGPGLRVTDDAHAYVDRCEIIENDIGIELTGDAHAYVDRCEIIGNDIGIELAGGANLVLRNSIAWTGVENEAAVSVTESTADISYSTIAHLAGLGTTHAISCSNAMGTTVRNSLIVARPLNENGWNCNGASISNTAGENIPDENGNVLLCDSDLDCSMDVILGLFASPSDLRLSATGANILAGIPLFAPTDLPYDIDLNPRPSQSGTDYAGAHAPP